MEESLSGMVEFVGVTFRNAAQTGDSGRLGKAALKLFAVADRMVGAIQAESFETPLACGPGCDACCHRLIKASLPEAIAAADFVEREWSPEQKSEFQDRLRASETQNAAFWSDQTSVARAPCAFLVNGSCAVYSCRPLMCRGANGFSRKSCEAHFLEGDPKTPPGLSRQEEVGNLSLIAGEGCQRGGLTSGLFDFGATVGMFLSDPELRTGLRDPMTPLERVKLLSEWNSKPNTGTTRTSAAFSNAKVLQLLNDAREGQAERIRASLPGVPEGPAKLLLGMTLPGQYLSQDSLLEWWANLSDAISRFESNTLDPAELFEAVHYFNTFNWAYAGQDVRPYMERFMGTLHSVALASVPYLANPIEAKRKPGKFRLGYVSTRLKAFNGSRWALGLLARQSPEIESYVVNLTEQEDLTSLAFRRHADHYIHLPVEAIEAGRFIRSLDLDALIFTDVGMCGRSLQLASMRLARRQYNGWGHPVTSGSPTTDFYVSSYLMEPQDGGDHYSETLIRLPVNGLSTPYRPAMPSLRSASDLGVPESGFLLYCQLPNKHIPAHDALFKRVIEESSKPLVIAGALTEEMKAPLRHRLGDRNTVFLDVLPRPDYLRLLELADASIESPAFGGAFTALDALSVGTPVITLPGPYMRGRLSAGYLQVCGIGGFQAKSEDEFVALATDPELRSALMERFDRTALFDNSDAISEFERILLG